MYVRGRVKDTSDFETTAVYIKNKSTRKSKSLMAKNYAQTLTDTSDSYF
jgi:hypothetical protein